MEFNNSFEKAKWEAFIAQEIWEVCQKALGYSDPDYHYNVVVTTDCEVWHGDLHISCNSWTDFGLDENEIAAKFNLCGLDVDEMICMDENDPDDDETQTAYSEQIDYSYRKFADEMAHAIVNGLPTEDIYPTIEW